jgi:hypothetical protein
MNNRLHILSLLLLLTISSLPARAQKTDTIRHPMHGRHSEKQDMDMDMGMPSAFSLNLPMTRNGSGTGWNPDASPMYGYMVHSNGWMFMFHGDIFPRYNRQDLYRKGSRGAEKWDAPDMLMTMGQRKLGANGLFHFNLMMSTDALITGKRGYPLLFQTGESANGQPLVDRQHPHDLFSELSVSYTQMLSKKADVFVYLGYPGEPALGPVTFMHRPSGMFMPDAPIGHHWADATHITFGVATVGARYDQWKLEGSSFTGREPNEERYGFDKPRFDSWSGRLSFNPGANWALQVSHGYIKSPEALHPDENINRNTASATYAANLGTTSWVAATALWGQNKSPARPPSNSALLEATIKLNKWAVYGRGEWVQKSVEELNLNHAEYGPDSQVYQVGTATAGLAYDLFSFSHLVVAGGGQLSLYKTARHLKSLYGNTPLAGEVYLHIYPGAMR